MDDWKVKQLCDDIERSCRPRDEINLTSLCNKHPNIYGEKASDLRRTVQKKFDLLKRKTIHQYAHFLDSLEVTHGAATTRELRRTSFKVEDSSASTSTAAEDKDDNDNDGTTSTSVDNGTTEDNDSTTDLETLVGNVSIAWGGQPEPAATTPVKPATTLATTPVKPTFVPFSPNNNMMSPPAPSVATSEISDTYPGSRNSPHIIEVDIAYPERNGAFFVQHVHNLEHNQHVRSGFHIRHVTAVQDRDLWEARIYGQQSRSIMIKGPSRNWWLTQSELYSTQFPCDATKKAHDSTGLAIGRDQTRQWTYWLLIFPESIVFDNVIFSGDPVEIDTNVVGMATTEEGMALQSCVVYWQVSEKFGGRRIKENTKSSIANLFSSP
jgi:hypothetical protein